MIEFDVVGTPAPQGSKTAVLVQGKARLIDKNPKALKAWRSAVEAAGKYAVLGLGDRWRSERVRQGEPVELLVVFRVERGKTVKRRWPSVRPDLDKYIRATCDALTKAGVYHDDSQVVALHAKKRYVREGETPGARIVVRPVNEGGAGE